MLIRNGEMIQSYAEEFNQYLGICKSLMRIYTAKDKKAYFATLMEYEKEKSNSFIGTESLSWLTMPENIIFGIIDRIGNKEIDLVNLGKTEAAFENNIESNTYRKLFSSLTRNR
jgi:hypothetical protein